MRKLYLYKIVNDYGDGNFPGATAHWVATSSESDALRIAEKYKIGNPMGRDAEYRTISKQQFRRGRQCRNKVWMEEKRTNPVFRLLAWFGLAEAMQLVGYSRPLDCLTFPILYDSRTGRAYITERQD